MYFIKIVFVILTIGSWTVRGLDLRPTNRLSFLQRSSTPPGSQGTTEGTTTLRPITTPTPTPVTVVNQYDNRNQDGSYDYRYELTDGTVRYERGFIIRINELDILVVKGYYSYPLSDNKYLTVFYTADHNGYRQDSSNISINRPVLPRALVEENESPKPASFERNLSSKLEEVGTTERNPDLKIPNLAAESTTQQTA